MVYIGIAAGIFILDIVLKILVEKRGKKKKRKNIAHGKMYLTKLHNKGAFYGTGKKHPFAIAGTSVVFCLFTVVIFICALKGNCFWLDKEDQITSSHFRWNALKTGLAMLLGGAMNNTLDRVTRGYVVDYIGFNVKNEKIRNVVFNVSDFFIGMGVLLALLCSVIVPKSR